MLLESSQIDIFESMLRIRRDKDNKLRKKLSKQKNTKKPKWLQNYVPTYTNERKD